LEHSLNSLNELSTSLELRLATSVGIAVCSTNPVFAGLATF
jgi:hypothetical protein